MMDLNRTLEDAGRDIAPTGRLRACINLGNPVLASRDPATGSPRGVSVDLARELARRLALELELVVFDSAGDSVAAIAQRQADIGFFALDPQRAAQLRFTPPYVLIEGAYVVRSDSPLRSADEVDQSGHRVVVGQGSAYDLFLTRELKQASILRSSTSPGVIEEFLLSNAEVAAGVRQQLVHDVSVRPGLRLLDGNFMVIQQAMGLPLDRSDRAVAAVSRFIEEMKAQGFVHRSLASHGIEGVRVAGAQGLPGEPSVVQS